MHLLETTGLSMCFIPVWVYLVLSSSTIGRQESHQ